MAVLARSLPQNKKFSAMVGEVTDQFPLIPYRRAFAREVWKRFIISRFIHEARLEAYCAGRPDPFPVRPVPSSELDSRQMSELIEFTLYWCSQNSIELTK